MVKLAQLFGRLLAVSAACIGMEASISRVSARERAPIDMHALRACPLAGSLSAQSWRRRWEEQFSWQTPRWVYQRLGECRYQEAIWELEDAGFMSEAAVVKNVLRSLLQDGEIRDEDVEPLGMGGATHPMAVYLGAGVKAVFKRQSHHPSASYKSEVNAYLFDQLLDFRLVPLTVSRKVCGKTGSLQYFVADATPAGKVLGYQRSSNLNTFDYLLSNKDRNGDNVILMRKREVAIDHGLALRGANPLGQWLHAVDHLRTGLNLIQDPVRQDRIHPSSSITHYQAEPRILTRLEELSLERLLASTQPYLSTKKAKRIIRKKVRLLAELRKAGLY